ncbi:agmatinase [Dasania sp. GY-MA-18]|uniref:Agmatinase n=1 Tax=Dasania phycosphaerae TaxID=2950436 RepID=A0A9J6RIE9_9GAMM|nr:MULTISPECIES: agmatinase [Dasania]MCR8921337.1 agmatinase [Dasania sp. GY-MA-18]MCZ0863765.1 agmatinase [Dasania phycosphaerae]MCZ0867493.1 agmatinase [Dasania phycosphaerae]
MSNTNETLFGQGANTYANIFTYMGLPLSRDLNDEVDAVVMGVPYDLATTGRSGARFGPTGIRQASSQLRWEEKRWPWRFSLADKLKVIDYGDITFEDAYHESMIEEVVAAASHILTAGKTLLTLGGDHFITLPLLRAVHKVYGKVALVHFDAHTDNEQREEVINHGSMFHHAPIEGLIDSDKSVQVGIRTEYDYDNHPFTVLDAAWANTHSAEEIVAEIKKVVGDSPVYLSFDIDCLDPAYAPGTGTPVAGGISSDKAMQIIRALGDVNIVAMDLMEVAPAYDHADITALAGATLALEMLYMMAAKR